MAITIKMTTPSFTWDYKGTNAMYFRYWKKGKYHVDIIWLLKDLLYKEIPLTLYVSSEQIIKRKQLFVAQDYKGVDVKYLLCAFESICALNVVDIPKDLLYDIINLQASWARSKFVWNLLFYKFILCKHECCELFQHGRHGMTFMSK
jgi:hypothetical protein